MGVTENDTVIVACSGGPDSTALAVAMNQLLPNRNQLVVAHFNHRTRGEESDGDEAFVRELCERLGVKLRVGYAPAASDFLSEDRARRMRYEFLERVATELAAPHIAVAHTADDQAETILLRLTRGTGVRGLSGMNYRRAMSAGSNVQLIRAMLQVRRVDIDEYLRAQGIVAREDSSNADLRYARNRVRLTVMPNLAAINPAVVAAINRLGDDARLHHEMIVRQAAPHMPSGNSIDTELLSSLPQPIAAYILEHMHSRATRDPDAQLERRHIQTALELASRREPSEMHLPGNVLVTNRYGRTTVEPAPRRESGANPIRGELHLAIPGQVDLPDGSSIVAEVVPVPTSLAAAAKSDGTSAYLTHYLELEASLVVRGRLPGARYRPLGSEYEVKVQDLFVDAKVRRELRDGVPMVVAPSNGRVAWIVGFAPAEWSKVKLGDSSCIKLTWRRGDG